VLMSEKTIDERIFSALQEKRDFSLDAIQELR